LITYRKVSCSDAHLALNPNRLPSVMCQLKKKSIITTNQIDPQSTKSLHKQQDRREQEGKGKAEAEAYGLWLADDVGDGLGGFGEDG